MYNDDDNNNSSYFCLKSNFSLVAVVAVLQTNKQTNKSWQKLSSKDFKKKLFHQKLLQFLSQQKGGKTVLFRKKHRIRHKSWQT